MPGLQTKIYVSALCISFSFWKIKEFDRQQPPLLTSRTSMQDDLDNLLFFLLTSSMRSAHRGGVPTFSVELDPFRRFLYCSLHATEGFSDWGGRGYDDFVPGEVTKTAPFGDRTT